MLPVKSGKKEKIANWGIFVGELLILNYPKMLLICCHEMRFLKTLNASKCVCGRRSAPDHAGELTALPQTRSCPDVHRLVYWGRE